jgi:hypothetical protein
MQGKCRLTKNSEASCASKVKSYLFLCYIECIHDQAHKDAILTRENPVARAVICDVLDAKVQTMFLSRLDDIVELQ